MLCQQSAQPHKKRTSLWHNLSAFQEVAEFKSSDPFNSSARGSNEDDQGKARQHGSTVKRYKRTRLFLDLPPPFSSLLLLLLLSFIFKMISYLSTLALLAPLALASPMSFFESNPLVSRQVANTSSSTTCPTNNGLEPSSFDPPLYTEPLRPQIHFSPSSGCE